MFNKARKQYLGDIRQVFSTEAGQRLLAYLKGTYVAPSCVDQSPELTYYRLGQRELVQSILNVLNDPKEIDDMMQSINYTNEEI